MLFVVYIMFKNRYYKKWIKLKFLFWVDFLILDLEVNILVYIDNFFDGYMYMYLEEL